MPHRRLDLLAFARRLSSRVIFPAILSMLLTDCRSGSASTTIVVLDSSSPHDSLEVIALPVDPTALRSASPSARDAAAERALALRDSADTLDARFQRLRDTLNADSRAMTNADRRSPEYHHRFDDWRRRMIAADSLRTSRDRMRARISRSTPVSSASQSTVRATLLAATSSDGRRTMVRKVAGGDSVTLDLSHGEWWLTAVRGTGTPSRWTAAQCGRVALRP